MNKKLLHKRILVVDDNPRNVQLAGSVLMREGYNVEFATTVREAIEWVLTDHFDLILLDVVMPGKNGFQICAEIKAIKGYKEVPVIFISAHNEPEIYYEGFRVGGVDYIMKPIVIEELIARVGLHLKYYDARQKLDGLETSQEKFLTIISRELLSPLSDHVLMLERLVGKIGEFSAAEIDNMLAGLLESAREEEAIVDSLLTWAMIQTGRILFTPAEIAPVEVITSVIHKFMPLARAKSIELLEDPVCEDMIRTDPYMLKTVLRNLVSNAIKYTGDQGRVAVGCKSEGKHLVFNVTDTGIGMSKEKLESLFLLQNNDFIGWSKSGSTRGLGLMICSKFTDQMLGALKYSSTPNKGTTVELILPLTPDL